MSHTTKEPAFLLPKCVLSIAPPALEKYTEGSGHYNSSICRTRSSRPSIVSHMLRACHERLCKSFECCITHTLYYHIQSRLSSAALTHCFARHCLPIAIVVFLIDYLCVNGPDMNRDTPVRDNRIAFILPIFTATLEIWIRCVPSARKMMEVLFQADRDLADRIDS